VHASTRRKPLILIAGETLGLGGAEKVTVDLANSLHESGRYRVHVTATLTKDGLFADHLDDGIDVSLTPRTQALTALVALKKPDGIVLNNCRMAKQCINEMLHRHTPRYLGFFLHGASKWSMDLLPDVLPDGSEVVTISREAKAEILAQRPDIPRSSVGVITNCVDTKRFRPLEDGELLPERVWDEPHGPVFGYAGRFSGEKSLVTMVDVFRRARQRIPDARLLMVGGADPGVPVYEAYWTAEQGVVEHAVRRWTLKGPCTSLAR